MQPSTSMSWFDALAAWAEGTIGQPEWTRLEIELAAFSAHDEATGPLLPPATREFARVGPR